MDLFLAGRGSRYLEMSDDPMAVTYREHVQRRLFSYHYIVDNKADQHEHLHCHQRGVDCFLDSGAFSAFTKGLAIDLPAYSAYALEQAARYRLIAALDVIGDAEASWSNYLWMLEQGSVPFDKLMPCFHYGEPYEALDRMASLAHYIAIGGVAQLGSGPKLIEWLDHIWSRYLTNKDGTARTNVHGFAVTGIEPMLRYPWASVDSSSWIMQAGTGVCSLYVPSGNRMRGIKILFTEANANAGKVDGWHYDQIAPQVREVVDKELMALGGFTAEHAKYHYGYRFAINAATYRKFETLATKSFKPIQSSLFA